MVDLYSYIGVNPEVQNGQPVFKCSRVPVDTLFMHLEKGLSVETFLDDFPSVSKEQAAGVLKSSFYQM